MYIGSLVSSITSLISAAANNTLTQQPKFWVGTQANYDAIVSKDDNTIYMITES